MAAGNFSSTKKTPQNWNREPNQTPSGKHGQEGLGLCSMSTGGCSHTAGWQFLGTKKAGFTAAGYLSCIKRELFKEHFGSVWILERKSLQQHLQGISWLRKPQRSCPVGKGCEAAPRPPQPWNQTLHPLCYKGSSQSMCW